MVEVSRLPKPILLAEKEEEWTSELCQERTEYYQELAQFEQGLLSQKPKKPRARNSRYAHEQITAILEMMFAGKCAYCESKIGHITSAHVEHFRPQSIYPRLAYEWENLLLACPRCNRDYKKDRFPLLPDGRQPEEHCEEPCSLDDSDQNALINPCIDNPEILFDFSDEYVVPLDFRAQITRDVCRLDREALNDERRRYLDRVRVAARAYKLARKCGDVEERIEFCAALKLYASSSEPYSAMVRAALRDLGIDVEEVL